MSLAVNNANDQEKIEYMNTIMKAYHKIYNRDYTSAIELYNKFIENHKESKEYCSLSEIYLNLSRCLFHEGKVDESLKNLTKAQKTLSSCIISDEEKKEYLILLIKIYSYLSLTYLLIEQLSKSSKAFKTLMVEIEKEKKDDNKKEYFALVTNIFFKVKTLSLEEKNKSKSILENEDEILIKKYLSVIFEEFETFLVNKNIEQWISFLKEETNKLSNYSNINEMGFNFKLILFAYEIVYLKSKNELNNKENFLTLSQKYSVPFTSIDGLLALPGNDILEIQNKKIQLIKEFYLTLLEKENTIYTKENNKKTKEKSPRKHKKNKKSINSLSKNNNVLSYQEKSSSLPLIMIFTNLYLANIKKNENIEEEYKNNLIKYLQKTKNDLEKGIIKISNIKLSSLFSQDILNSLIILLNNLFSIYKKNLISKNFSKFVKISQNYKKLANEQKINKFLQNHLNSICNGEILAKINLKTEGIKEHFYKLDFNSDEILSFKDIFNLKNPKTKINVNEIVKISYGISTKNLKQKFEGITKSKFNSPWLFLSIITTKRSYDFYLSQEKLLHWYYGLSLWLKENKMLYKIISSQFFMFRRIKLQLIKKLKEFGENHTISNKLDIKLINALSNEKSIQEFSFIKLFLLFNSIIE